MTDFGDLTQTVQEPGGAANSTRALTFGGYRPAPAYWQNRIEFFEISSSGGSTDFGDLTKTKGSMGNNNSSKTIAFASGGYESPSDDYTTNVDRITINSLGNAVAFATLATASGYNANASNTVRSIVAGGGAASPGRTNRIEFNSFQSGGSGTDFGDLTAARSGITGGSNGHGGIETFVPRAPELYSPTGKVVSSGAGSGDIGLFWGGNSSPSHSNVISYVQISTDGNASDFGDNIVTNQGNIGACGGLTRGMGGGGEPVGTNVISYVEFATKGNAADFGDLTSARQADGALANTTRGIWYAGRTPSAVNTIDYVTIASVGNATDFGDATGSKYENACCSSSTRGISGGGTPGPINVIEYITIGSTGNGTDFGDLTESKQSLGSTSSTTRGVFMGGYTGGSPGITNVIEYITIASTGNGTDFGDMTAGRYDGACLGNSTRGLYGGGYTGSVVNTIDKITIASTGNATDFGDMLNANKYQSNGTSNGHGGL
jgi:hypothetical protein